ncbi:EF-hand calcium-binding domain-containing protein 1-like isoform X2 [Homarus americanus]|uniref:EF-hand calcium-binding domain-containing protein 1-like isoform X2 n=1 Tax=Homarus americanus TaxID=6706 RepID=UPI001C4798F6|nr:EF-hand calcium-binding domain-containing protein 1-like isoform X2 [Homarus americanus]
MSKNTTYKGYSKLAEKIAKNTHFTCEEVDAMLALHDLTGTSPRMDGNRFRDIMHGIFGMTDEGLMEAMYQVFDMDQDGCVGPEEFVVGMSVFLRGSLDEKIDYCFSVYDHNGDGMVSRDEMFHQLKSAVVNLPPGEELDEVVKDMTWCAGNWTWTMTVASASMITLLLYMLNLSYWRYLDRFFPISRNARHFLTPSWRSTAFVHSSCE